MTPKYVSTGDGSGYIDFGEVIGALGAVDGRLVVVVESGVWDFTKDDIAAIEAIDWDSLQTASNEKGGQ